LPYVRLLVNLDGGTIKNQFKKADRSGARFALVLGENELAAGQVGVKSLRSGEEQVRVALMKVPEVLQELMNN
jgi:histidyl-tRNA synthetase